MNSIALSQDARSFADSLFIVACEKLPAVTPEHCIKREEWPVWFAMFRVAGAAIDLKISEGIGFDEATCNAWSIVAKQQYSKNVRTFFEVMLDRWKHSAPKGKRFFNDFKKHHLGLGVEALVFPENVDLTLEQTDAFFGMLTCLADLAGLKAPEAANAA